MVLNQSRLRPQRLGSQLRPDPPPSLRFRVALTRIATEPPDDGGLRLEEQGVAAADLNGVRSHYPSGVFVVLMGFRVPAWEFRAPPEPYEQVASSVSYSWSRDLL